jgi:hypothetical protein
VEEPGSRARERCDHRDHGLLGTVTPGAAFFAFGVFGHSWTWFHLFFVIEFAGVLQVVFLVGLLGALGAFAGALAYEWLARLRPS